MMKRNLFIGALIALIATLGLTSCNDEYDDTPDVRITSQLPGTWRLSETQKDENGDETIRRDTEFVFVGDNFTASYFRKTLSRSASYSVSGTWKVNRQVLELRYNVASLVTEGMSETEVEILRTSLVDNNLMLDDLKDSHQPYGMPVEVTRTSAGAGNMKLSKSADFGGIYTLVGGGIQP